LIRLASILLVLLLAVPALARGGPRARGPVEARVEAQERGSPPPQRRGMQRRPSATEGRRPGEAQGPGLRRGGERSQPHLGTWLKRYQNLSPEEQERALESDAEFQKLSPEQQERLRRRLHDFSRRPAEEQQQMLQRMEVFQHMTLEQRQEAQGLFARFRELPEPRRRMVMRASRHLRGLPAEERRQALDSPRFQQMFSGEERDLLRRMGELGISPRIRHHKPEAQDDGGEEEQF
jgi:hypothetical protein